MLKLDHCRLENGGFHLSANLTVNRGALVAVIGPSGGGKTTLLEAIAGFLPLTSGRIFWQDADLSDRPPGTRPVAMLFQDGNLFPHLTVAQNVGLGLSPRRNPDKAQRATVATAIERVGLAGMDGRKPAGLSGGQRARAALARALVQRRDLLLLDEPFSALGPALKAEMLDLVAGLVRETGTTLLMVSHEPDDARRICDQVILVADGTAHPPTATAPLLDNPPPALRDYLG